MSDWEIKHLHNQLENQAKRLDYLNETVQKLRRKVQDKYFRAITWLMLLTYTLIWSFVVLHDHRLNSSKARTTQC